MIEMCFVFVGARTGLEPAGFKSAVSLHASTLKMYSLHSLPAVLSRLI